MQKSGRASALRCQLLCSDMRTPHLLSDILLCLYLAANTDLRGHPTLVKMPGILGLLMLLAHCIILAPAISLPLQLYPNATVSKLASLIK